MSSPWAKTAFVTTAATANTAASNPAKKYLLLIEILLSEFDLDLYP
jgi:hypothetical protein